ncbi:MAG TPA: alpha/beta hydrolase [Acidimicrobiia bacterium]|nr:alpha/beta hydrolase [Acidimicrobiia bacterium]
MDVDATIDPEIAAALAESPIGQIDFGSWDVTTVPTMRAAMENMPRPELPPPTVSSRDVVVDTTDDGAEPALRIYGEGGAGGRACIYWIHGGGYMFGSGLMRDARLERWAEEYDCVVVSVEYRLAPEHPYPAPLDDCYAGLAWTARNAGDLGIDPGRIAVVGASAGGGLAAGLALLARDRGEVAVDYQLLIYPMIDDRNRTASSRIVGAPVWSRDANLLGWRAYLGTDPGGDDVPVYAAPARATDLAGLPPTFIGVGTLDVFRDENLDYALRLLAAGVPTEVHVYPGACHGFEMIMPFADVSQRCQRDIDDALGRALQPRATDVRSS